MTFQQIVGRNFTLGFPGDIVREGPKRAKPARITSPTIGTDPGASTNRISRAFGYTGEQGDVGGAPGITTQTYPAEVPYVAVGGPVFFGILGHPKHYALLGTVGDPLGASIDLPQYFNAEFFDMVTGMVVQLFNEQTAAKTMNFGDSLAYVPNTISTTNNPLALPYGAVVSVPAGGSVPTGFVAIPNSRLITPQTLAASAANALVLGDAVVQLTQ